MKKIIFLGILALTVFLRFYALDWGLPTQSLPHAPYHPDEVWAMTVLGQVNVSANDYNPEEAHREGTLAYFLWSGSSYLMKGLGIIENVPHVFQPYSQDYATSLYVGRAIVAGVDVLTAILLFVTVQSLTGNFWVSLFSLLVFSITPFEIIHAHFLRTHTVANFFIVLVIFLATKIWENPSRLNYFLTGGALGLGFATRYPTITVGIVPLVIFLRQEQILSKLFRFKVKELLQSLFGSRPWLLLLGCLIGMFLGVPFLFLDFESVEPHIMTQASYVTTNEFTWLGLLNLDRVWVYVSHLIPHGTLPYLWILFYGSIVYLLVKPKLYKFTLPLLSFIALYSYVMAKGYYAQPIFIRAAIPLFPVFAILVGLAFSLLGKSRPFSPLRRFGQVITFLITGFIIVSTLLYDLSYLTAMKHDARDQVATYFRRHVKKKRVQVNVLKHGHNYFTTLASLPHLKRPHVALMEKGSVEELAENADFVLLGSFETVTLPYFEEVSGRLRQDKRFKFVKRFTPPMDRYGFDYFYPTNPHDLQYPLVSLELWSIPKG